MTESTTYEEIISYVSGWRYKLNSSSNLSNYEPEKLHTILKKNIVIQYLEFQDIEKPEHKLDFLRGYFDKNMLLSDSRLSIPNPEYLTTEMMIVLETKNTTGLWTGISKTELLTVLYHAKASCFCKEYHIELLNLLFPHDNTTIIPRFRWSRKTPDAVAPFKNRPSDTGFDLHIISKLKEVNGVCYYDTGISVEPPPGFYFDIVGRSSISKTGWMLANNIGIIDASYRGSIIVALVKIDVSAKDLSLPLRIVQMIPRQLIHMNHEEVSDLTSTTRGSGGFGSSG